MPANSTPLSALPAKWRKRACILRFAAAFAPVAAPRENYHNQAMEVSQCADELDAVIAAEAQRQSADAAVCGGCGGPYRYDVSIPSDLWNRVVRARGGSEYLCASCILQVFADAGESFTATLAGETLNLLPISVTVGAAPDRAAIAQIVIEMQGVAADAAKVATWPESGIQGASALRVTAKMLERWASRIEAAIK